VGRRDRERARRRHAIERARRARAEHEPAEEPAADPSPGARSRGGPARRGGRAAARAGPRPGAKGARIGARPVNPFATKGRVGDIDHRGRVRKRDMLVHPRITSKVVLFAFVLALPGALLPLLTRRQEPALEALTFVAFSVSFAGLADLARTRVHSVVMLSMAVFSLMIGVTSLLAR
jgi:hypothetical protein